MAAPTLSDYGMIGSLAGVANRAGTFSQALGAPTNGLRQGLIFIRTKSLLRGKIYEYRDMGKHPIAPA
ncbi:MAG: hypothetical protein JF599_00935 [Verrucomicrobia bacterium]|nr:hypothetical protein [Verrucomicrobiota bacterium]